MEYLDRNATLLAEVSRKAKLKRGVIIGESHHSIFFALGSYESAILGQLTHVGLKDIETFWFQRRLICELAVIAEIARRLPDRVLQLPAFYGGLVGRDGEPLGYVTEDFSVGGKHKVVDDFTKHQDIKELFRDTSIHDTFLNHIGFRANGQTRLGDFYPFFLNEPGELVDPIRSQIDRHMLQIDYELA